MKSIKNFITSTLVICSIIIGAGAFAQTTKLDHGNRESTTIKSNKDGSTIERGTKETTRETHKEAVERTIKESRDKGEKADKVK
jgi:uncharacterized protein YxeA